jgi:AcrR family transcriptional regulator
VNKPTRSVPAHRALVDALVALVLEKRFDAITVQQLLDRAAVGRTTFYQRYRSKDDLLLRSFEQMLRFMDHKLTEQGDVERVAPVRELFMHVREARRFHHALSRSRKLDDLYTAAVECLSATIASRLEHAPPLLARGYAGALVALMRWWVEHGAGHTAQDMDELFHGMVRGTLTASGVIRGSRHNHTPPNNPVPWGGSDHDQQHSQQSS